ncbi:MAG: VCBS repeat-containing protein, partial [Pyrinomonadaceae bacterium]|nr:VCBS repeat-containing protein [Pyrinomonadaceae bacterium]
QSAASLLNGDGQDNFQAATGYAAGVNPAAIAVGDFNGDAAADLVVTNSSNTANTISLLNGDSKGTFAAPLAFAAGAYPSSLIVKDFDGDDLQDLAVTNANSGAVSILTGDGASNFSAPVGFGVGLSPSSVAAGDFNSDGCIDLAVADFGTNGVSILLDARCEATTIAGRVTDARGRGLSNVLMLLSLDGNTTSVRTDNEGNYSLDAYVGESYLLRPVKSGYLFLPRLRLFPHLREAQTANFIGLSFGR